MKRRSFIRNTNQTSGEAMDNEKDAKSILLEEFRAKEVTDRHEYINILRQHIKENPKRALLARHRIWMDSLKKEYPMPYIPYKIGVYIRYYNQTKHDNYIEKHKQQFIDDIAMCPLWTLVDFYIDKGMSAPHMENSREWCRLFDDCLLGKVDLIVTQKVSSVSSDPEEITFIARMLAAQKKPVGIYFISEDIYTLASYYMKDLYQDNPLPEGWEILPEDDLDRELIMKGEDTRLLEGPISSKMNDLSDP